MTNYPFLDALPGPDPRPRACPKGKSRAELNGEAEKDDKRELAAWSKAIWKRDKGKCRACGIAVVKRLDALPDTGDPHHIVGRADKAVRYDTRNGLLVCRTCHDKLTGAVGQRLHITGTAKQMFTVNGRPYLNADCKLRFL